MPPPVQKNYGLVSFIEIILNGFKQYGTEIRGVALMMFNIHIYSHNMGKLCFAVSVTKGTQRISVGSGIIEALY